jgi:acyl-CoA thioesterase-1
VRRFAQALAVSAGLASGTLTGHAEPAAPVRVVALGDSLTAGYGLAFTDAFPAKLERALAQRGIAATIANAGVSGDTSSGGLARLDWSIPSDTEAVIVELGGNDVLRGIDPKITRAALDGILSKLKERGLPVLLCGMLSPPNLGGEFARNFNAIFPELAEKYGAVYYPFFLQGVAGEMRFNQRDGLHPTAEGIELIVKNILPKAQELVSRVRQPRG